MRVSSELCYLIHLSLMVAVAHGKDKSPDYPAPSSSTLPPLLALKSSPFPEPLARLLTSLLSPTSQLPFQLPAGTGPRKSKPRRSTISPGTDNTKAERNPLKPLKKPTLFNPNLTLSPSNLKAWSLR